MKLSDRFTLHPNVRKWLDDTNAQTITEQQALVIHRFFLVDHIDYEKVASNTRAHQFAGSPPGDSVTREEVCTLSFKQVCAGSPQASMPWLPSWFLEAYPDVTLWVTSNLEQFREKWVDWQQASAGERPAQLRYLIDYFKTHKGQLECGV